MAETVGNEFLWGVSISGFQFEMGDLEGRGVDPNSDWFAWVHDEKNIRRGVVSGDLPENGVNYWFLYKRDHELARELGLNAFRLGIEWSRIFPRSTRSVEVGVVRGSDGRIARVDIDEGDLEKLDALADKSALEHYRAIISDLREKEFKVFVCLNHFTLPKWIHDPIVVRDTRLRRGPRGWVDEETAVEFAKYAAYVAWKLGDFVDYWATFNEPMVVTEAGYVATGSGFPPGVKSFRAFIKASTNIVIAHARAYDMIKKWDTVKADDDSPSSAVVGLIHSVIPAQPRDPVLDVCAAEYFNHVHNKFILEASVRGWLDENMNGMKERGEVKSYLGNRLDWLGVNYYTRAVIKGKFSPIAYIIIKTWKLPEVIPGYGMECKPNSVSQDGRPTSDFGWEVYPEGLREAVRLASQYARTIFVTENGIADKEDKLRPRFILEHLKQLKLAVEEDKIPVGGYFHWSLVDNYEWAHGFKMKFGLYAVNLETKERVPRKKSVEVFKEVASRGLKEVDQVSA